MEENKFSKSTVQLVTGSRLSPAPKTDPSCYDLSRKLNFGQETFLIVIVKIDYISQSSAVILSRRNKMLYRKITESNDGP